MKFQVPKCRKLQVKSCSPEEEGKNVRLPTNFTFNFRFFWILNFHRFIFIHEALTLDWDVSTDSDAITQLKKNTNH